MTMDPTARRTFLRQYAVIRHAEGRGSHDPEYYRALPWRDLSGHNADQWKLRSRSYRHFERAVLRNLERTAGRPLRILDLGAGNGWMSNRLRQRGHSPVAIDIFTDPLDGLGALRHYEARPDAVAAEFDVLPFRDESIDLAIFNSSLHYSADYRRTLHEVRRCLRSEGCFIVLDSPVYEQSKHGEQMRAERQEYFSRTYGFRSESLGSIEYLDEPLLASLAGELSIEWRRSSPWYGWRWALRPWQARLKGRRPPSRFFILVGKFR
jgi:ubiquinone/menaquinone biosynthesis C-methylase UbiE